MPCCIGFEASKTQIEDIVKRYHASDYKIFIVRRDATEGLIYKVNVGVVVKPDVDKNTQMFEEFIRLGSRSDSCVKVLHSDINFKDERLVDLFLLEIESEALG